MAPRNRVNVSGYPYVAAPAWAGKQFDAEDLLPGGAKLDDTSFTAYTASVTVTTTAGAAIGATSLAVAALSAGIPAGTVLNFGNATTGVKLAYVTVAAAAAAVALTVSPLVNAVASGDAATFPGQYGKMVPSGTYVSRTYAQRAAGGGFHAAVSTDDEFFLVAEDVPDVTLDNDVALVMPGDFPVKENFLPNYAGITAVPALLTSLRSKYVCTLGAE